MLLLVCGCSRAGSEPAADAPLDDELVAAASSEVASAGANTPAEQTRFRAAARALDPPGRRSRCRGYFEQAIAAREERPNCSKSITEPKAWQMRTARPSLARENRLHDAGSDPACQE